MMDRQENGLVEITLFILKLNIRKNKKNVGVTKNFGVHIPKFITTQKIIVLINNFHANEWKNLTKN